MRYLGLLFVGMVLWAGQASTDVVMNPDKAREILLNGETISEIYRADRGGEEYKRIMRIRYNDALYICTDQVAVVVVKIQCFDETRPQ